MNKDCKESLKPVDLINIYEVDPIALRCKNTPNINPPVSRPKKLSNLLNSNTSAANKVLITASKVEKILK